jgi:hypothetical protein
MASSCYPALFLPKGNGKTLQTSANLSTSDIATPKLSVNFNAEFHYSLLSYEGDLFRYQYSETNVMHFLFNLLRIKGLYMFRTLLAHPQEALHKRHLVRTYIA